MIITAIVITGTGSLALVGLALHRGRRRATSPWEPILRIEPRPTDWSQR